MAVPPVLNKDPGSLRAANRRLALKLVAAALAAFGFAFALVPLYDVLCRVTGLNGKTSQLPAAVAPGGKVDRSRWITVEFMGNAMSGSSVEFRPSQAKLRVHPGELALATYVVKNPTNRPLVGQAVPSVSPGDAARYFKKIECFCFKQQIVNPGETREMPVTFVVSPELPQRIDAITLSYAFFNAEPKPGG